MAANIAIPRYRHRLPPPNYGPDWLLTELVNVEQKCVGQAANGLSPYAILVGEVGVVRQWYPLGDLRRYGAVGDGATDDATPFANAIASAIAAGFGYVIIPPGYRFAVGSALTIPTAITIYGLLLPAGGIGSAVVSPTSSTVVKMFDGDLFTFNGADGTLPGSGGGIWGLRIVNAFGSSVTADGCGYAVVMTGVDPNHAVHWGQLDRLIVENSVGSDSWTGMLHVDGLTPGTVISDLAVRNCSAHIPSANGRAVLMEYGSGQFSNCTFYQTGANVEVTGDATHKSSASSFINCNIAGTFMLDYASGINLYGGIVTSMTDTANTAGTNVLAPGQLLNPFTSSAALATGAWSYRSSTGVFGSNQMIGGTAGLAVGNTSAATTLGSVVARQPVYDMSGALVGYAPLYDTIT